MGRTAMAGCIFSCHTPRGRSRWVGAEMLLRSPPSTGSPWAQNGAAETSRRRRGQSPACSWMRWRQAVRSWRTFASLLLCQEQVVLPDISLVGRASPTTGRAQTALGPLSWPPEPPLRRDARIRSEPGPSSAPVEPVVAALTEQAPDGRPGGGRPRLPVSFPVESHRHNLLSEVG